MTRINADISPRRLSDQHLIAETREILRLRHLPSSKSKTTPFFKLGAGHVLFFKDKLRFAHRRYKSLHRECIHRGFKVKELENGFEDIPLEYYGEWTPSSEDESLIVSRIEERLLSMKRINYYGRRIEPKEAIELLKNY